MDDNQILKTIAAYFGPIVTVLGILVAFVTGREQTKAAIARLTLRVETALVHLSEKFDEQSRMAREDATSRRDLEGQVVALREQMARLTVQIEHLSTPRNRR